MRNWAWIFIVSTALAVGGSISLLGYAPHYLEAYRGDWLIFWRAANAPVELLYSDLDRLPFAYPPSALFLLKPFGLFPQWVALGLWSAFGVSLFYWAGRKIASPLAIALALLMPAAYLSLLAGQTSLIVGALVLAGFTRPGLWGLVAVIKPQSLVALPLSGEWAKMFLAGAVAVALVMLSVAVWGFQAWLDWFAVLDDFQALVEVKQLEGVPLIGAAYPIGAVIGAVGVWITRNSESLLDRFAMLSCGSVLISPYALPYDLAGLSIAAMAMLLDREQSIARWIAAGWIVSGVFETAGVILMISVIVWEHGFQAKAMKAIRALP